MIWVSLGGFIVMKFSPPPVVVNEFVMMEGRGLALLAEVTVVLVVANGPFTRLKDSELKLEGTIIVVNQPAAVLGGGELELEVVVILGG